MPNINLPLPDELLEAIDAFRGDVPRTRWIRALLERQVEEERRFEIAFQQALAEGKVTPAEKAQMLRLYRDGHT